MITDLYQIRFSKWIPGIQREEIGQAFLKWSQLSLETSSDGLLGNPKPPSPDSPEKKKKNTGFCAEAKWKTWSRKLWVAILNISFKDSTALLLMLLLLDSFINTWSLWPYFHSGKQHFQNWLSLGFICHFPLCSFYGSWHSGPLFTSEMGLKILGQKPVSSLTPFWFPDQKKSQ